MIKILVAEDDKFLSNAYKVKLQSEGFDVRLVMDGNEALKAFDEFKPDIFLLDLVMPKTDGFAVLEKLHAEGKTGNTPIIVASNLGQNEDVVKAKGFGAVDYVIKSDLSMKDLLEKIAQYVPESNEEQPQA